MENYGIPYTGITILITNIYTAYNIQIYTHHTHKQYITNIKGKTSN